MAWGMTGNRNLSNVGPASDAVKISLKAAAIAHTLTCLKEAVNNNFVPAFTLIASAGMTMHFEGGWVLGIRIQAKVQRLRPPYLSLAAHSSLSGNSQMPNLLF